MYRILYEVCISQVKSQMQNIKTCEISRRIAFIQNEKFVLHVPMTLKHCTKCVPTYQAVEFGRFVTTAQVLTILTSSRQNITANISKASHVIGEYSGLLF